MKIYNLSRIKKSNFLLQVFIFIPSISVATVPSKIISPHGEK